MGMGIRQCCFLEGYSPHCILLGQHQVTLEKGEMDLPGLPRKEAHRWNSPEASSNSINLSFR